MKISEKAKHAIFIGTLCSVSYLAVYIVRNTLSAVSPQMKSDGFTEDFLGFASALYFVLYAVGQLVNGAIGDKIKARYMISLGLLLAGISNIIFSLLARSSTVAFIAYGSSGFFLAMIYGPMTKVVAENTEQVYATRCSLGYTFASFLGSPLAGIMATFMAWQSVYLVSSGMLLVMAVVSFVFFLIFEKRGIVKYGQYERARENNILDGFKVLIKRGIIKYSLVAIITGIVRTSVVFWLPMYLSQRLMFDDSTAAGIFSAATFIISFTTFITVFVYEKLGRRMELTMLLAFISSTVFFTMTFFVRQPVINIVCMIIAIMSSGGAASMLFSRYCPSLYDTGMVSTATGFIDFLSYMAAATANVIFANAVKDIGWDNLILIWVALVASGIVVALPYKKIFKSRSEKAVCESEQKGK